MPTRPHTAALPTAKNGECATAAPFHALLDEVRVEVDRRLVTMFQRKLDEGARLGPDVVVLVDAVRDLTMRGGKRFRPALLVAAFHAVDDGAPRDAALQAGAALELLQTYLLVHDDWMDRDEVRRGGPAVHTMLGRHYGSREVGDSAALLAGDYASALAQELLATLPASAERIARAALLFSQIQQDAIRGQHLDLTARPADVEVMHDLKTGSYTVRGPLLLGAALAGAPAEIMTALARFARPLGIAFQLRDDLLSAFGRPADTGKPFGSDIRSGKKTVLVEEAMARLAPAERPLLTATMGRAEATDADVERVVGLYERCGARRAVEERLDRLVGEGAAALSGIGLSSRGAEWLLGAATALTARER